MLLHLTGGSSGIHSCGTLPGLFLTENELHMKEIGLYGPLFGQARWKFILDLSNQGAIEVLFPLL